MSESSTLEVGLGSSIVVTDGCFLANGDLKLVVPSFRTAKAQQNSFFLANTTCFQGAFSSIEIASSDPNDCGRAEQKSTSYTDGRLRVVFDMNFDSCISHGTSIQLIIGSIPLLAASVTLKLLGQ